MILTCDVVRVDREHNTASGNPVHTIHFNTDGADFIHAIRTMPDSQISHTNVEALVGKRVGLHIRNREVFNVTVMPSGTP